MFGLLMYNLNWSKTPWEVYFENKYLFTSQQPRSDQLKIQILTADAKTEKNYLRNLVF